MEKRRYNTFIKIMGACLSILLLSQFTHCIDANRQLHPTYPSSFQPKIKLLGSISFANSKEKQYVIGVDPIGAAGGSYPKAISFAPSPLITTQEGINQNIVTKNNPSEKRKRVSIPWSNLVKNSSGSNYFSIDLKTPFADELDTSPYQIELLGENGLLLNNSQPVITNPNFYKIPSWEYYDIHKTNFFRKRITRDKQSIVVTGSIDNHTQRFQDGEEIGFILSKHNKSPYILIADNYLKKGDNWPNKVGLIGDLSIYPLKIDSINDKLTYTFDKGSIDITDYNYSFFFYIKKGNHYYLIQLENIFKVAFEEEAARVQEEIRIAESIRRIHAAEREAAELKRRQEAAEIAKNKGKWGVIAQQAASVAQQKELGRKVAQQTASVAQQKELGRKVAQQTASVAQQKELGRKVAQQTASVAQQKELGRKVAQQTASVAQQKELGRKVAQQTASVAQQKELGRKVAQQTASVAQQKELGRKVAQQTASVAQQKELGRKVAQQTASVAQQKELGRKVAQQTASVAQQKELGRKVAQQTASVAQQKELGRKVAQQTASVAQQKELGRKVAQQAASVAQQKELGRKVAQQAAEIGKQQQNKAATTIQAYTRRHLAKKEVAKRKEEVEAQNKAATTIQSDWKDNVTREKKEEEERVLQIIRLKKENQLIASQSAIRTVQVPQEATQIINKSVVVTASPKETMKIPLQSGTITQSPSQKIVWHTGSTQNRVKFDPLLSAITSADLRKILCNGAHTDKGGSLFMSQCIISELNRRKNAALQEDNKVKLSLIYNQRPITLCSPLHASYNHLQTDKISRMVSEAKAMCDFIQEVKALKKITNDMVIRDRNFKEPTSLANSVQEGDKRMSGYNNKTYIKQLGDFFRSFFLENKKNNFLKMGQKMMPIDNKVQPSFLILKDVLDKNNVHDNIIKKLEELGYNNTLLSQNNQALNQQINILKMATLAHHLYEHAENNGKGFQRGSFTIQDDDGYFFDWLKKLAENTPDGCYSRKPSERKSSHYKDSDEQYGVDIVLKPNNSPVNILPYGMHHILFGRVNKGNNSKATFVKCENYGLATWSDLLLHGVEYLHTWVETSPYKYSNREKDLPGEIKDAINNINDILPQDIQEQLINFEIVEIKKVHELLPYINSLKSYIKKMAEIEREGFSDICEKENIQKIINTLKKSIESLQGGAKLVHLRDGNEYMINTDTLKNMLANINPSHQIM